MKLHLVRRQELSRASQWFPLAPGRRETALPAQLLQLAAQQFRSASRVSAIVFVAIGAKPSAKSTSLRSGREPHSAGGNGSVSPFRSDDERSFRKQIALPASKRECPHRRGIASRCSRRRAMPASLPNRSLRTARRERS